MPDDRDNHIMNKFIKAQEAVYGKVLSELRAGHKQTHWMWFIFPQIDGLGRSPTALHYAVKNIKEAQQYLNHPVLGARLMQCTEIMLDLDNTSALAVFGKIDAMKFKSSMTLFMLAADSDSVFEKVLDKYFNGERDSKTLEILNYK